MAVTTSGASRTPSNGASLAAFLIDHLVWGILIVILALCSVLIPHFFQPGIFVNIMVHATFVGLISIGLSFCIIVGHMDLSVESVMAFSAMLGALLSASRGSGLGLELPAILVLLSCLAFGAIAGLANAFLIVKVGINSFIVTLAGYIMWRGLGLVLTGGRSMYGLPEGFRWVAAASLWGIPALILILVAAYLFFGTMLRRTRFGRWVYLVGGNPMAPFRAGIPVDRVLYLVFVLSGVLAALAGWLLAARTNGATPNLGLGMLFEAFAAVVIGGVSLRGGTGRLSGVFAGVLLLSAIDTAINVMGLDAYYTQVIRGGLMLLAVLLDSATMAIRRRVE
jgi:ribose transport system permease protein